MNNSKEPEYPYLPKDREIKFVSIDNSFMQSAKDAQENLSTESNHPTGSVVVKDGKVIGRGGNGAWIGKISFLRNLHKKYFCIRRFFKIPTGQKYWICPGCANHSDHSEQKAVKDAQKKGFDLNGADLYLYGHWWCCKPCWDVMIKAGIKNVYLLDNSRQMFKK